MKWPPVRPLPTIPPRRLRLPGVRRATDVLAVDAEALGTKGLVAQAPGTSVPVPTIKTVHDVRYTAILRLSKKFINNNVKIS